MIFNFLKNLSIHKQLVFGITAVHTILMSVFVFDMTHRQKEFLTHDSIKNTQELVETIAANSISWVLANDVVGLQEIVSSQKANLDLLDVMVVTPQQKIIAHSDQSKLGKFLGGEDLEILLDKDQSFAEIDSSNSWIKASAPIKVKDRIIGRVVAIVSLKEVNIATLKVIKDGFIYVFLAIIIGALFAWLMANYLSHGFNILISMTRKISAGERGLRATGFHQYEFQQLSADLNSMLDALESKESHLLTIQESLSVAKEQAEVASRSKADFLANMSHEIRTPINAVIGFCEVLEDTDLNFEQQEFLSRIKNSVHVLQGLIDDILEFSRIESAKIQIEKSPFGLRAELNKVIQMHEVRMQQKNLQFNLQIDPQVPELLLGDSFRLLQILNNLLSNAIKFTSYGSVELFVRVLRSDTKRVQLEFSVKDSGIGIHEDQIKLLFSPFTQADSSITRKYGGTGLGLAISQHLAHLMNGHIRAESKYGIGSTFILEIEFDTIPQLEMRKIIKNEKLDVKKDSEKKSKDNENSSDLYKGKTLLIVDDNLVNLELTGMSMKKFGFNTLYAENGEEAVQIVKELGQKIDLILMDLQMPILDGYQATQKIRKIPGAEKIPIIAISARAFDSDVEKCLAAGMNDHIAKPYVRQELLDKLSKNL